MFVQRIEYWRCDALQKNRNASLLVTESPSGPQGICAHSQSRNLAQLIASAVGCVTICPDSRSALETWSGWLQVRQSRQSNLPPTQQPSSFSLIGTTRRRQGSPVAWIGCTFLCTGAAVVRALGSKEASPGGPKICVLRQYLVIWCLPISKTQRTSQPRWRTRAFSFRFSFESL